MRPSRCPDWVFGTNSFRMVLVTLGCSLFEASFSRGGLANQAGIQEANWRKCKPLMGASMSQHRTYILFTEGGGGGGSRWIAVGWFCVFIFLSKFIDEKLSSNPSSPEGHKIQSQSEDAETLQHSQERQGFYLLMTASVMLLNRRVPQGYALTHQSGP